MRPTRLLLSAALVLLAGCGGQGGAKTYPLKSVMLEIEARRARLERALLRSDGTEEALQEALRIQRWMADPAADRYLEGADVPGSRADFERLMADFTPRLERLIEAARAGDQAAAREAFAALEAGCNACHALYRPDLAAR